MSPTPTTRRLRPELWLLAVACVLLAAQASFHLLAYPRLDQGLLDLAAVGAEQPLPSFDVLRGAWILYAVHLLIASLLCAACAVAPRLFGRGLRMALVVWLGLDTALLFYFVGPFLGSVLMAISASAVAAAALLPARQDEP
ncbi:hypothetical protein [Aquimonas voraii]|uniref:Uncharacterized protein n=1 Tax=Aquimonas voraii TaxID=265719 RepID=A0A1G6SPY2_9GAMM|nr:hypothetical protein [Aquimonas voraii]SDD18287.1 hypothetical protein SAMN04488509_101601 [Aquimonas voraii]